MLLEVMLCLAHKNPDRLGLLHAVPLNPFWIFASVTYLAATARCDFFGFGVVLPRSTCASSVAHPSS